MKTHHQQLRMALFAVIVLVAGTSSQAVVVSYIAVDLNPSGFFSGESYSDSVNGKGGGVFNGGQISIGPLMLIFGNKPNDRFGCH